MSVMSLQEMLDKGKSFFEKSEYAKAEKVLSTVIEESITSTDQEIQVGSYFLLANIFHIKGEIGKSIKAFNKVLELDPSHTDASISLSVLYNDIGHYENAKKVFEQANERVRTFSETSTGINEKHINKKFAAKHFELAEMYLSYSRLDEGLFEYEKSIQLDPENLNARLKIAKTYAKKGFTEKAKEELKKLKSEQPEFLEARNALGVLYYGSGRIIEAQEEWRRVVSKDPINKDANLYLNLSKSASETRV